MTATSTRRLDVPHLVVGPVVGEGATARVYRATDVRTGEAVAVKILRRHLVEEPDVRVRFEAEAELLGRFDHPNLSPLLGRGRTSSGAPWFATRFAPRGSLADQMLRNGALQASSFLPHVAEVLDALEYLHGLGIVHRDVKPGNILLDANDVALLSDFGVALVPDQRRTMVGDRMGTPSFMPPEQYDDPRSVGPTADVFGAGTTLYVGLTGETAMMLIVSDLRPQALSALPQRVAAVVDRATRPLARDRYPTARAMALDLADAIEET